MRRLSVGILVALGLTLVTTEAAAQEWLKDRRIGEGAGVRTGDFELHPGIAGEIGYDSNYFLRSPNSNFANSAPAAPPADAGVFRLTPSLSLSTLGPQRKEGDNEQAEPPVLNFRAGIAATYREFLLGNDEIRRQRNIGGTANLRLDILPRRTFGFGVYGSYQRLIQPNTSGNLDLSFNRNDVTAGAEVIYNPGGGTFDWRLGYAFNGAFFEKISPYDSYSHEAYTRAHWSFRPRTALLGEANIKFSQFTGASRVSNDLHDSSPVRARFGIQGLITPRFEATALVGYGASLFRDGGNPRVQQYSSVIGNAEAKFYLTSSPDSGPGNVGLTISSIAVGYIRDFAPSYLGDFYGLDRVYGKFSYFYGGRFLVSLDGGLGFIEYPDLFINPAFGGTTTPAKSAFTDKRVDGTLFSEYRFSDSWGINTTLRYTANLSDNVGIPSALSGDRAGTRFDLNWRRFEALLGVRWFL